MHHFKQILIYFQLDTRKRYSTKQPSINYRIQKYPKSYMQNTKVNNLCLLNSERIDFCIKVTESKYIRKYSVWLFQSQSTKICFCFLWGEKSTRAENESKFNRIYVYRANVIDFTKKKTRMRKWWSSNK